MTTNFFYLLCLASLSSALWIRPGSNSSHLTRRTSPTFSGYASRRPISRIRPNTLVERTDPTLQPGDFGENWDGEGKKGLLEDAIPDVYKLVYTSLTSYTDGIFDHWFPLDDKENVKAAFRTIIDSSVGPSP